MQSVLLAGVRTLIGFIFLISAIGKIVGGTSQFAAVIDRYNVVSGRLSGVIARTVIVVELMLSVMLTLGLFPPLAGYAAAALVAVFALVVAINLLRGQREIPCGCFGSRTASIGWHVVLRNLVMIAASVGSAEAPSMFRGAGASNLSASGFGASFALACGLLIVVYVVRSLQELARVSVQRPVR